MVALVVCAVFTAFTGASGLTIFALGGLLFPTLIADGYSERFSLGLITSSGSLGLLFPPSLPLILYGVIAEQRIDQLFLAGIIPGTLLLTVLIVYSTTKGPQMAQRAMSPTIKEIINCLRVAVWEIPLPAIVHGVNLIYLGIIFLTDQQIGYCTPPVDLDLFLASYRFEKKLVNSILPRYRFSL